MGRRCRKVSWGNGSAKYYRISLSLNKQKSQCKVSFLWCIISLFLFCGNTLVVQMDLGIFISTRAETKHIWHFLYDEKRDLSKDPFFLFEEDRSVIYFNFLLVYLREKWYVFHITMITSTKTIVRTCRPDNLYNLICRLCPLDAVLSSGPYLPWQGQQFRELSAACLPIGQTFTCCTPIGQTVIHLRLFFYLAFLPKFQ